MFQHFRTEGCNAKSEEEGADQCRHHAHDGRDLDGEECWELIAFGRKQLTRSGLDETREERHAAAVGEESREDGGKISRACSDGKHLACTSSHIGNGRRDQSDDDERNEEVEQLGEDAVERVEDTHADFGHYEAKCNAEGNGNEDAEEERDAGHRLLWGS